MSAAIVHDQETLWSGGFGVAGPSGPPATADTLYSICSISKLFTSIGVMQLRDAGKLSLEDPVEKHLSWFGMKAAPEGRVATIQRHPHPFVGRAPRVGLPVLDGQLRLPDPREDRGADRRRRRPLYPSERYLQYSNLGLTLAGEIVSAVSGEPYDAYVRRAILQPLGMKATFPEIPLAEKGKRLAVGHSARRRDGTRAALPPFQVRGIAPAAGFASTANDLARFAAWQFRVARGQGRHRARPAHAAGDAAAPLGGPGLQNFWGLGFWTRKEGENVFVGHGGSCPGFRSQIALDPQSKVGVAVLANASGVNAGGYARRSTSIVAPVLKGKPPATPPRSGPRWRRTSAPTTTSPGAGRRWSSPGASDLGMVSLPTMDPVKDMDKLRKTGEHTFRRVRKDDTLGETDRVRDGARRPRHEVLAAQQSLAPAEVAARVEDPGAGTADAGPPRLVRAIGRWDLTASVVNGTIGSAIFGMPAVLAAATGAWSPLAALFAALGILLITLCHAEVASRFREAGGTYLYAREAYGRQVGFQMGWLSFWIRVTSMGANLNVFVDYLGQLAPSLGAGAGRAAVMCAVTAIVTALNVVGVRQGARTVDFFTLAKLLPLVLLVVLGATRVSAEVFATQAVAAPDWTQAVLLLVFAYGGFEAALVPASEAKDPRRDSGVRAAHRPGGGRLRLHAGAARGRRPRPARGGGEGAGGGGLRRAPGHIRGRVRERGRDDLDLGLDGRRRPHQPARALRDGSALRAARVPGPRACALPHPARRHLRLRRRRPRLRALRRLRRQRDDFRHHPPRHLRDGVLDAAHLPAPAGHGGAGVPRPRRRRGGRWPGSPSASGCSRPGPSPRPGSCSRSWPWGPWWVSRPAAPRPPGRRIRAWRSRASGTPSPTWSR